VNRRPIGADVSGIVAYVGCPTASGERRPILAQCTASPPTAAATKSPHPSSSRRVHRGRLPLPWSSAATPPGASAIHFSSCITSCAVCSRSSGSFDRHTFTSRSKAGGVSG
jgi:hypothetical protein